MEQRAKTMAAKMLRAKRRVPNDISKNCFLISSLMWFSGSLPLAPCSLLFCDLIRPREHVRRDRQADLLGGLEIDDQLELRRLLHWNFGGLGTFENFVHVGGGAAEQIGNAHAVAHESAVFDKFWRVVNCREPVLRRKLCNQSSLRNEGGNRQREDCIGMLLTRSSKPGLNILRTSYL